MARIVTAFLFLSVISTAGAWAQSVNQLFPTSEATHTAINSGDWGATTTWAGGAVPASGGKVHIGSGVSVVLAGQVSEELKWVRVDGQLRFATDVDSELRVGTLVSTTSGRVEIGTATAPVPAGVTARVVFVDDGAIDRTWDNGQLSRGAVLMGQTEIYGAAKTSWLSLAVQPTAGSSTLQLSETPVGWQVGDELVVAATSPDDPAGDERVQITGIGGASVTFSPSLQRDHIAPAPGLDVHVANMSRNVILSSENPAVGRRGHVMFMHTLDVDVNYALFKDLGRTDKSIPLDDVTFPDLEASAAMLLEGDNPRGRYSVHFHRGGSAPGTTPARVRGSVVDGNPGWAYVNHSSNVDFIENVSYDVVGGAFQTEAGDEIGSFVRNIALRTINPAYPLRGGPEELIDIREDRQDFAFQGDGFWLHGGGPAIDGNVVAGASGHAYIYWTEGLIELGLGEMQVPASSLPNGHLLTDGKPVNIWWMPLTSFDGNHAYSSVKGVEIYYMHASFLRDPDNDIPQAYIDLLDSTFENLTLWSIERNAIGFNYSENLTFRNVRVVGNGLPGQVGINADHFHLLDDYRFENLEVEGYAVGMEVPTQGDIVIEGGTFSNKVDFRVLNPQISNRNLVFRNVSFGDSPLSPPGARVNYEMTADFTLFGRVQDGLESDGPDKVPDFIALPDRISIDSSGQVDGLFYAEQAADFVPLPDPLAVEDVAVPEEWVGLTNQQLQDQFDISFGRALLPSDARTVAGIERGLLGTPAPPVLDFEDGLGDDGDETDDGDGDDDDSDDGDDDDDSDDGDDDDDSDDSDDGDDDDSDDGDDDSDDEDDDDSDDSDDGDDDDSDDDGDDDSDDGDDDDSDDGDDDDSDDGNDDDDSHDDGDDDDSDDDGDDDDGDDDDSDDDASANSDPNLSAVSTDAELVTTLPTEFGLANYPNPFNPTTNVTYSLPKSSMVRIRVYDMLGRVVSTLVDDNQTPGTYSVVWDGRDLSGRQVVSGAYLYQMIAGDFTQTRTMVLLK